MLSYCLRYCDSVIKIETVKEVVVRFLAEFCLQNSPVTVDDSNVSVPLPSPTTFALDFNHVTSGVSTSWSVEQTTMRSNHMRNQQSVGEGVASVLNRRVDMGLRLLKRILARKKSNHLSKEEEVEEEGVLEWLWCVLVCIQHTRYDNSWGRT